jgi:hypothetical protein
MRNEVRAQARAVAESELESLFFKFRTEILNSVSAGNIPPALAENNIADDSAIPTTDRDPFLAADRLAGWRVRRSTRFTDSIQGWIPATETSRWGSFSYVDAKIEVRPPVTSPFADVLAVRVGRQFSNYSYSIFQHAIFYEGDLELYPGADVTVKGDVVANGSIYMGSKGAKILLTSNVNFLAGHYFNSDADGNLVLRKPGTPGTTLTVEPIFDPDLTDGITPDQVAAKALQLRTMQQAENLLGGTNAGVMVTNHPDLFPTVNDVYRALIMPPPEAGNTNEYSATALALPDVSPVKEQRIYNHAGLKITVNTDGTVVVEQPVTPSDLTAGYTTTTAYDSAIVTYTDPVSGAITKTKDIWDQRELRNVQVTTIDVGILKQALLDSGYNADFNGILYVNLKSGDTAYPSAVKLVNGADVPHTGQYGITGFAVATNGGLYVQGDFNTTLLDDGTINPAMLMGDAMTLLSSGWDDANASQPLTARIADTGGADNTQKVFSGLVVGNTSATADYASGGVQNLVRYLEDWTGKNVLFDGSIGRLFNSKMFTQPFQQPGSDANVYNLPLNRNFEFNSVLTHHPPPGSPSTVQTTRGRYYFW